MSPVQHKARVSTLSFHLADEVLIGEGSIMAATAIQYQEALRFQALEELGEDTVGQYH